MKRKSWIILLILIIATLFFLGGCKEEIKEEVEEVKDLELEQVEDVKTLGLKQLEEPEKGEEIATIKTNHGDIKVKFFPEVAPKAVENFVTHGKNGYYDGLTFHRVMEDFMIQSGDPKGTGAGGESIWGQVFEDEFHEEYHNFRGALSMAKPPGPDTNGSQFFIVQAQQIPENLIEQITEIGEEGGFSEEVIKAYKILGGTPWLDNQHTVFGQVFQGMDVVDKIASVAVDSRDKPLEAVIIREIIITNYE